MKLRWLIGEIRELIRSHVEKGERDFIKVYLPYRDIAFFLCLWWARDRAADLGRTKTCEVTRIDERDLLFNHTIGKTVREGDSSIIVIPKLDSEEMDPVGAVDKMMSLACSHGRSLVGGYLFRPSTPDHKDLANKPFVGNGPNNRLKRYSSSSGDPDDLNLRAHGGRAGVAVTLRLLGATEQQVMDHCGWAAVQTYVQALY